LKACNLCKLEKEYSFFNKDKKRPDGYSNRCKDCVSKTRPSRKGSNTSKEYWSRWYKLNREHLLERQKSDPRRSEDAAKRYQRDKERILRVSADYRKTPGWRVLNCTKEAKRRSKKIKATPDWLTPKQEQEIKNFYWLAKDLEAVSGETYHVDHIIPLQGKDVCGLHVPWNLQVLPHDINLKKSNRIGYKYG